MRWVIAVFLACFVAAFVLAALGSWLFVIPAVGCVAAFTVLVLAAMPEVWR